MKNVVRWPLIFLWLLFVLDGGLPSAWGGGAQAPAGVSARSTEVLKATMAKFGALLAGLEVLRLKEKKPDWEAIHLTLDELTQALSEMQKADATHAYKEYTDVLAAGMVELRERAQNKDKKFFQSVDKLTDTCFKCHAAHRPGDYLMPKGNQQISGN